MKKQCATFIIANTLLLACAGQAAQVTTLLPLRHETSGVAIYNGVTCQTVESDFGTNLLGLPFSGTTTYDFYSPPLTTALQLVTPGDKGSATIFLQNRGATTANDFHVTARMQCYDYDATTGANCLLVDTGDSQTQNIQHGQTTHWNLNAAPLPSNYVFRAGHQVHIALTVTLIWGNPGNGAQVLYNGPYGTSTVVMLPQNDPLTLVWPFDPKAEEVAQAPVLSITRLSDGTVQLNGNTSSDLAWRVEATTNLAAPVWSTIGTNLVPTNGLLEFIDKDAPNYPFRFYRLVAP